MACLSAALDKLDIVQSVVSLFVYLENLTQSELQVVPLTGLVML